MERGIEWLKLLTFITGVTLALVALVIGLLSNIYGDIQQTDPFQDQIAMCAEIFDQDQAGFQDCIQHTYEQFRSQK